MKLCVISSSAVPAPPSDKRSRIQLAQRKYRQRNLWKLRLLKKRWDERNKEHVKEYSQNHHIRSNDLRRHRRQLIYDQWGRTGRQDWRDAERIAVKILEREGYHNIELLTDEHFDSPFDIVASIVDLKVVYQVTTRTHTDKKRAHKLAKSLGLVHKALFISLQLEKYIIKDFSPTGITELSVEEVSNARKYV